MKLLIFFLALTPVISLIGAEKQDREYEQVLKIAMRDPGVRAAYVAADKKRDALILKIDPALKGYMEATGKLPPAKAPKRTDQGVPGSRSHVVSSGDTLSSVARKYGTTVAALKQINAIPDESQIVIGQVLILPKSRPSPAVSRPGGKPQTQAAEKQRSAAPVKKQDVKSEKNWWEKLLSF